MTQTKKDQSEQLAERFIDSEILTRANSLVEKLFELVSYDFYEVASNLMYDSADYKAHGFDSTEAFEESESIYKNVLDYYLITERAYKLLDIIKEPLLYVEELHLYVWGCTNSIQALFESDEFQKLFAE